MKRLVQCVTHFSASADAQTKMPSTHICLHTHLVFSTKDRVPAIGDHWRERLHSYLGGIVKGLGGTALRVGGTSDHIHLLVGLKSSHRLDYFVRDLKADSSAWIHDEIGKPLFAWQKGYGAFAVSPSHIERVRAYIANQEQHHRRLSFQQEYLNMLCESGVEYDEKYLW